jgi:putative transposase
MTWGLTPTEIGRPFAFAVGICMARPHRLTPGGVVYHVINRGSRKGILFDSDDDYIAFEQLISRALSLHLMRIIAYCLMSNHVHFLLWPERDGELSRFMHWLTGTHAGLLRRRTCTTGQGAVYQSRFKAAAAFDEYHMLTARRYIERNPLDAQLVTRADLWRWSSASPAKKPFALSPGPCPLPANWPELLHKPIDDLVRAIDAGQESAV